MSVALKNFSKRNIMLKFANLSLSQKRFVVAVIESNPQYKKDPQITLKECAAIYYTLRDQRTGAKGEKIGYPNWLFNKNKVERGVYQLPVPTDAELSKYTQDSTNKPSSKKIVKNKKVVKVAKPKAKPTAASTDLSETTRLEKIINDSVEVDQDTEDFNQILRDNGIEV